MEDVGRGVEERPDAVAAELLDRREAVRLDDGLDDTAWERRDSSRLEFGLFGFGLEFGLGLGFRGQGQFQGMEAQSKPGPRL